MIIAIDFDGTIVESAYPQIGKPNLQVIAKIKEAQKEGNKIILWTCREGKLLEQAIAYCKNQGIVFDAINENIQDEMCKYKNNSRKIFAHKYIDDRAESIPDFIGSAERTESAEREKVQPLKRHKMTRLKK